MDQGPEAGRRHISGKDEARLPKSRARPVRESWGFQREEAVGNSCLTEWEICKEFQKEWSRVA